MINVIPFNQNNKLVAEAVKETIVLGADIFRNILPNENFSDSKWNIIYLKDRNISNTNPNLYFCEYGSRSEPLPDEFCSVVKAWLILNLGNNVRSLVYRLDSVRVMWAAIMSRRNSKLSNFSWENLNEADVSATEDFMKNECGWADSTIYKRISSVIGFIKFLEARNIIPPINCGIQTPRTEDTNRFTIQGQEKNLNKLPSNIALQGLADVFCRYAVEPPDRFLICAVTIQMVTGLRVGELLTLPFNCKIEEMKNGKPRYGILYYKEKPGSGERRFEKRWLTPKQEELARKAIEELKEITASFRVQAKLLEDHPYKFPLPGLQWNNKLNSRETAKLLGDVSIDHLSNEINNIKENGRNYFRVSDIANYLQIRRVQNMWTLDRNNGTKQMLSESLLIAPKNFFHQGRGVIRQLIEPVTVGFITDFLTGKKGAKSVFERFEIKEENGDYSCITSHMFRHWLNTVAFKGGLPIDIITRWMGRDNPKDTAAYLHMTQEERIEWVKKGIREEQTQGIISKVFFSLPKDEAEIFLDDQIKAVHFTHLGVCTHDYAVIPCEYQVNCIRGCENYVRNKGNAEERKQLVQIKRSTERVLESAKQRQQQGGISMAPAWIKQHEQVIAGVVTALAVDDEMFADEEKELNA